MTQTEVPISFNSIITILILSYAQFLVKTFPWDNYNSTVTSAIAL